MHDPIIDCDEFPSDGHEMEIIHHLQLHTCTCVDNCETSNIMKIFTIKLKKVVWQTGIETFRNSVTI